MIRQVGVVALVALALGGCAGKDAPKAAPSSAAPSPSPSPVRLDERAACVLLIPATQDGTVALRSISEHPDGSTLDVAALDRTLATFDRVSAHGPSDLTDYVQTAANVLRDLSAAAHGGGNRDINTLAYTLAASGINGRCAVYS